MIKINFTAIHSTLAFLSHTIDQDQPFTAIHTTLEHTVLVPLDRAVFMANTSLTEGKHTSTVKRFSIYNCSKISFFIRMFVRGKKGLRHNNSPSLFL